MDNRNKHKDEIVTKNSFTQTDSDKANQLAPSSPSESTSKHPQADAAASSADNDMDRMSPGSQNQQEDAEEAQSDGNLSFPEGK
jgi:hypothetical protein